MLAHGNAQSIEVLEWQPMIALMVACGMRDRLPDKALLHGVHELTKIGYERGGQK